MLLQRKEQELEKVLAKERARARKGSCGEKRKSKSQERVLTSKSQEKGLA